MTSPYIQQEADRLGIVKKTDQFDWMKEAIYEPAPTIESCFAKRSWLKQLITWIFRWLHD